MTDRTPPPAAPPPAPPSERPFDVVEHATRRRQLRRELRELSRQYLAAKRQHPMPAPAISNGGALAL